MGDAGAAVAGEEVQGEGARTASLDVVGGHIGFADVVGIVGRRGKGKLPSQRPWEGMGVVVEAVRGKSSSPASCTSSSALLTFPDPLKTLYIRKWCEISSPEYKKTM